MAIRSGDWVLVRYDVNADGGGKKGVTAAKLYNLADDIGQTKDRAAEEPDRVRLMQETWNRWNTELAPPRWGGGKRIAPGPRPAGCHRRAYKKTGPTTLLTAPPPRLRIDVRSSATASHHSGRP